MAARTTLHGRVVAITGSARGIGLATAKVLAGHGAQVFLGDLDGDLAAAEGARLGGDGWELDVTHDESFGSWLERIRTRADRIDVLVNNAGIMPTGPFLASTPQLEEQLFAVNFHGVARGIRLVLPEMLARRDGQIVNVASVAGRTVAAGMASYAATKHAVVGLTRALRREHHGAGVHFTLVMPSFTRTRLVDGAVSGRIPVAEAADVAAGIAGAIAEARDELIVPRQAAVLTHVIERGLPRSTADALARRMGADRMFLTADGRGRQDTPTHTVT